MDSICPLCNSHHTVSYQQDSDYRQCSICQLIYTPQDQHLNESEEKSRYDQHQNDPQDQRYRDFLSKVFNPVLNHIKPGQQGLDFGCGPGPTLSLMFNECGYQVDLYDKYYAADEAVFSKSYDFITTTEVAEHLEAPGYELDRLFSMLNPGGVLALMTQLYDGVDFAQWHYKNDPTHICFYHSDTMRFLAARWQVHVEIIQPDVALFYR